MGAKPIFSLRISRRSAGIRAAAGAFSVLACCLSACISDGPNKTGGDYLSRHGILLQTPLYQVRLSGMPVDTFWTTDAETVHLGDSILLAGHSGDFTADARFAFHLSDTAMLDSLDDEADSSTLKLSLGFPPTRYAFEELKATVNDSLKNPRDSVRFLVSAWDTTDIGKSPDEWNRLITQWNRQFLERGDTLAALPAPSTTDTISVAVKTAYAHVSQSKPLPNLRGRLRASPSRKHLIELRMSPIFDSAIDSGAAMLRLGGQQGDEAGLAYGPLLLFGRDSATGSTSANRLQAMVVSSQTLGVRRGVNYSLRYAGPATNILPAKQRGLHLILNRKALLDSIDTALIRQGVTPGPRTTSGDFDVTYFVPFAKLTLPLAGSELEGGFPLQMNLVTSTDSLLGDETTGAIKVDEVPLDEAKVLWQTFDLGNRAKVRNDVSLAYRTVDSSLRRVELTFSVDSGFNDTLFIAPGETKQMATKIPGVNANNFLTLKLEAGGESLTVRSYLTLRADAEPNEFRDPATGELITDMEKRVQRFLRPGQTRLTLRATNGIQRMLNQVGFDTKFLPAFQIQPAVRPAFDTTVDFGGGNTAAAVPYPVLSVVSPELGDGILKVDVELYLFPLKAR